ncbi:MAG: hypothetical protein ACI4S2_15490 [Lachnospiraceae bacterium]
MRRTERFLFAISLSALWCLIMPPYLYGILGIFTAFGMGLYAGRKLKSGKTVISTGMKWYLLLPLFLCFYMADSEFVERWYLSSKMQALAGIFKLTVEQFLWAVAIAGTVVGAYAVLYLLAYLNGKAKGTASFQKLTANRSERKLSKEDMFLALSITLALGMRLALNPLSDTLTGNDSAAYIYVGLMMKKGATLYVDIFEHKGVFLYLMTVIGTWLTGGSLVGIWILELINAFVSAILILKTTKLFTSNRVSQYLTTIFAIASVTICMLMTDGNLSEEWALPWMLAGLYVCMKYFVDGTYRFYEILLMGVGCAYIIFLRANMIAVFAAFMPIILVQMILKKNWKDIGICALNFTLGLVIVAAPIVIDTILTGSFQGMMDNYFLFSMSYCEDGSIAIPIVMWELFKQMTVYSILLLMAIRLYYKEPIFLMNLWFYVLSLVVASMSGRAHAHYAIILIPALIVPMVLVFSKFEEVWEKKDSKLIAILTFGFFAVQLLVSGITYKPIPISDAARYMREQTNPEDNVLVLGNNCIYYLEGERYTTNRYFYQTPVINVSDEHYEEFVQELRDTLPDEVFMIGVREELEEFNGEGANINKVYQLLDTWCQNGVYSCEVYDSFTVYRRN